MAPEADLAIHFCPFAYDLFFVPADTLSVACRFAVHRVPSDAAGATCHSLFVNTQRYASLLSPFLAFCISVYITYTGIASFYPIARVTTSADATLYSISLHSASLASRKIESPVNRRRLLEIYQRHRKTYVHSRISCKSIPKFCNFHRRDDLPLKIRIHRYVTSHDIKNDSWKHGESIVHRVSSLLFF